MVETGNSAGNRILERIRTGEFDDPKRVDYGRFAFRFAFRGIPLVARIVPHESGSLHMQIMGLIGRLPYSAEGREKRLGAMLLLRATAKRRPTRFAVTRTGNIALAGDVEIQAPVTPSKLMIAVTTLVASAKPYLDLFPMFVDPLTRAKG